jgi:hypothetical protein
VGQDGILRPSGTRPFRRRNGAWRHTAHATRGGLPTRRRMPSCPTKEPAIPLSCRAPSDRLVARGSGEWRLNGVTALRIYSVHKPQAPLKTRPKLQIPQYCPNASSVGPTSAFAGPDLCRNAPRLMEHYRSLV